MPYMSNPNPCVVCKEVGKVTRSNLAVIPKVNNLRKGNYYSIHD